MEFKIINKYLQEEGRTFVSIRCSNPYTKLGIWKWTEPKQEEPKPAGELETQPVQ